MKKRTAIIAALSAVLLAASLSGCGNSKAPGNSASTATSAQGAASTGQTQQSEAPATAWKPDGPVQIVLPAKPGGDLDSSGRLFAKDIEAFLGQTAVPVNVEAGGGNLALKQIMDGKADGMQLINYFSYANAVIGGKLEYGWDDLVPVACYAKNDTQILVCRSDAPYKNASELVAYMKENPGKVTFAVTLGSPSHYHSVAFEQAAGVSFKKVDISSGSDKVVAMLSGECDIVSSTVGIMKDYLASGEAVALGALVPERSSFGPDIPTLNEQGVNIGDVGFGAYYTVWAKAGTPQEVIDAYADMVKAMVDTPSYQEDCANLKFEPYFMSGDKLKEYEENYFKFLNGMSDVIRNDHF